MYLQLTNWCAHILNKIVPTTEHLKVNCANILAMSLDAQQPVDNFSFDDEDETDLNGDCATVKSYYLTSSCSEV